MTIDRYCGSKKHINVNIYVDVMYLQGEFIICMAKYLLVFIHIDFPVF